VGGDVNGAGQFFALSGPVERGVFVASQKLTLQSTIGGSVDTASQRIEVRDGARVAGDFNYTAEREAAIVESFIVGSLSYNPTERHDRGTSAAGMMLVLVSLAACALVIVLLAPRFVERSRAIAYDNPITVGLAGFAAVFGGPIVVLFLMVSIVLLPLGLLALALWFAA